MIRTREELEREIQGNPGLLKNYEKWNEEQQKEFMDYCTGVKGVKILYDAFFKEIMNPENTPERLNELLSLCFFVRKSGYAVFFREIPQELQRKARYLLWTFWWNWKMEVLPM